MAGIMSASWPETASKGAQMTLKTPENHLSFGLNGSHKARKFFAAKGPRLCPPPDISKTNGGMRLRPIMTAHDRQNRLNSLAGKELWNGIFSKNHSVRTDFTKYYFRRGSLEREQRSLLAKYGC